MNVGLAFRRNAVRYPGAAALFEVGPQRRDVTWVEFEERTNRLANALVAGMGIAAGDRVALLVANRPEVVEVLGGITKAGAVYVGLNFRLSRSFEPSPFAETVRRQGVTHSFLVPTQLIRLLGSLPPADDGLLEGLVTLGYGASPISPERLAELVGRFGNIFSQLYGMAEIASIGTMLRKEDHQRGLAERPELLASCGQPSYVVDVRVVDADGNDTAPGERGEVIFGGPYVMEGYYRDPERTAESLRGGGSEWQRQQYVDPPRYDDVARIGADAYRRTFAMAGLRPDDVDVFELYDINTFEVVRQFETLGFCAEGEGVDYLAEAGIGAGGRHPTNTDGGLMACSHVGFGGPTLKIVEAVRQTRGTAGVSQVPGAESVLVTGAGSGAQYHNAVLLGADR